MLLAFQAPNAKHTFFIFGFSKNERDNIAPDEKALYLSLDEIQLSKLIAMKKLFEANYEQ